MVSAHRLERGVIEEYGSLDKSPRGTDLTEPIVTPLPEVTFWKSKIRLLEASLEHAKKQLAAATGSSRKGLNQAPLSEVVNTSLNPYNPELRQR